MYYKKNLQIKKMHVEISDKYDREFINLMIEIEKKYDNLTKTERIRLESWVKI